MARALAPRDLLLRREQRSSFSPFDRKIRPPFLREGAVLLLALRSCSLESKFRGRKLITGAPGGRRLRGYLGSGCAQMALSFKKAVKWWEKGLQPNMNEIESAEHLVESLTNSGDKLTIVHFFSPGCAGCRALHPKICQFAELNPELLFLQINYEEHKSMCYSLRVHVLPFFRFYRGANGRLCSFSCTNATIKKFKDALVKHNTERCSLGPARGLEEAELLALAANRDLSFTYSGKHVHVHDEIAEIIPSGTNIPVPADRVTQESDNRSLAAVAR